MPRYAELIYNGFWFSPEREALQALIDKTQEHVTGTVRVKLYKGRAATVARWSDHSLYSEKHVTFEEDAGAYDQKDAEGFIRLNAAAEADRDQERAAKLMSTVDRGFARAGTNVARPRPLAFDHQHEEPALREGSSLNATGRVDRSR
jgi:hypothetical protein